MIAALNGILVEATLISMIVEVHGIGYELSIPMSTYDKLPRPGEKVSVLTYMHVREDAIQLYGFATADEKKLFLLLTSVNGVGPRIALNILSSMPVSSFCGAINSCDLKMLGQISGIGKKTAERLVLELKSKIKTISPEVGVGGHKLPDSSAKFAEDAALALAQLGFKYDIAAKTIHEIAKNLPEKECSSENLIRLALNSLNK